MSDPERIRAEYERLYQEACRDGSLSKDQERAARKSAIEVVFAKAVTEHPSEVESIWDALRRAHISSKASVDFVFSAEQISAVNSAAQSWVKQSGHAAESLWKSLYQRQNSDPRIQLVLQRDLSKMIANGEITNEGPDINIIREWLAGSYFDLYFVGSSHRGLTVFGCVQSKTSIRERVGNDREHSQNAMSHFFWSTALVINGAFLGMPKFQSMVNGGSAEFIRPGWHGLYALSTPYVGGRIVKIDPEMHPVVSHAIQALEQFESNRQWFNESWQPT